MRAIVIDTREQRPYSFPEWVNTCIGTLKTGDYALYGDECYAIERKSLDDFLGTIFSQWDRFRRELGRMDAAGFPSKVIVVEADFESLCWRQTPHGIEPPHHGHPQITPSQVIGKIAELSFMGVQVLFCGDRNMAAAMVYHLLRRRDAMLGWSK